MRTFTSADAKNNFGELIDLARAAPVSITKYDRPVVVVMAVEEFERLRGTNLAWFGLDELTYTQEDSWLRLEGRLRDPMATRLGDPMAVWPSPAA